MAYNIGNVKIQEYLGKIQNSQNSRPDFINIAEFLIRNSYCHWRFSRVSLEFQTNGFQNYFEIMNFSNFSAIIGNFY